MAKLAAPANPNMTSIGTIAQQLTHKAPAIHAKCLEVEGFICLILFLVKSRV